ncbi:hypothetical protein [Halomarina oriensis]|uniref:Uncharacterized protein n=1 Tax=Halomarina oriensis TaxID=671145 RepID=A0A6B0GH77_9EURY|nr:hypothetical protein [Halomarina oriensis]MWG33121.1 hypothetical protein [Halomarina oriensis]
MQDTEATTVHFDVVGTAHVRHHQAIKVGAIDGLRAAGLTDAASLRYHVVEHPDGPLLVAEGLDVEVDGRAEPHARPIYDEGGAGGIASIPAADFEETFGIDRVELTERDVDLEVLAAPDHHLIAFRLPPSVDVDLGGVDLEEEVA